jgi:hypothetical protein
MRHVAKSALSLFSILVLLATLPCLSHAQLSTADHLADPGFWPTENSTAREEYTGSAICASCHAGKVASQRTTAMAQTSMHVSDSKILQEYPELTFDVSKYHYAIRHSSNSNIYTVSDGAHSASATLLWAFGNGRVGQSYLFKKDDGNFYEARVTFFDTLKHLHFTPSRALANPRDLDEAMARPVPLSEVQRCFGCHSTAPNVGGHLDEQKLVPGVSCEACHGPGAKHVTTAKLAAMAGTPDAARGSIFTPAELNPADAVDFCGACHTTFWDVKLTGAKGVSTAKSQPYRLQESKCWGNGDARLTCVACHDPHQPLQTDLAAYDSSCLKCHGVAATQASVKANQACRVGTKNCATCHMPKIYDPEMHYAFTDHRIRVVKPGEAYPN